MKIDEAIAHARQKSEDKINYSIIEREEHEQLAEWLEELKALKNGLNIKCDNLNDALEKGRKIGYCKAIDDFVEKISIEISESIIYGMLVDSRKYNGFNDTSDKIVDYVIETSKNVAEQLKEGGEDD